jgi:hypothetical protein
MSSVRRGFGSAWPWLLLGLMAFFAVWHAVDFDEDPDGEFPKVARPVFSARPPAAYRLAEPGDTIDRVAIYVSAFCVVAALGGWIGSKRSGGGDKLWPLALVGSLAALWHAATPGPTFDGWHGLGWRTIFDPSAPAALRLTLLSIAVLLAGVAIGLLARAWPVRAELWKRLAASRSRALLIVAAVLVLARQVELPGVEPVGYWPRWAFVGGLTAFLALLVRNLPVSGGRLPIRVLRLTSALAIWLVLAVLGITVTWYHRPIDRFKAVVPGKIYISAMPTYRGLEIVQKRHKFKTIINLFPEDTELRSPLWPQELRFVDDYKIRYLRSPNGASNSDRFLDQTLAVAQDPEAWPILVHCHGCMDRTPAWVGVYRFLVEGTPLAAIMQENERHRGYRPKASVTLLYNRVLKPRAPQRYEKDPTAALLRRCAEGTVDPYYAQLRLEEARQRLAARPNREDDSGVQRSDRPMSRDGSRHSTRIPGLDKD